MNKPLKAPDKEEKRQFVDIAEVLEADADAIPRIDALASLPPKTTEEMPEWAKKILEEEGF